MRLFRFIGSHKVKQINAFISFSLFGVFPGGVYVGGVWILGIIGIEKLFTICLLPFYLACERCITSLVNGWLCLFTSLVNGVSFMLL